MDEHGIHIEDDGSEWLARAPWPYRQAAIAAPGELVATVDVPALSAGDSFTFTTRLSAEKDYGI